MPRNGECPIRQLKPSHVPYTLVLRFYFLSKAKKGSDEERDIWNLSAFQDEVIVEWKEDMYIPQGDINVY